MFAQNVLQQDVSFFFSLRLLQARAEDIVKSRMQWKRKRRTTVDKVGYYVL